jgi:hypothetical protein
LVWPRQTKLHLTGVGRCRPVEYIHIPNALFPNLRSSNASVSIYTSVSFFLSFFLSLIRLVLNSCGRNER